MRSPYLHVKSQPTYIGRLVVRILYKKHGENKNYCAFKSLRLAPPFFHSALSVEIIAQTLVQ